MKARICVIRQGFYPLDPRVRREVLALEGAGHEVDVVCLRRPDEPGWERIGNVTVHRISIASRGGGKARYLFEYGGFMLVAAFLAAMLHLRRRFDLVQVNSMPDTLVFAAVVPRLLGAHVLLDLHECMPEFYAVKYDVGMRHPAVRVLAWLEQAAIRFADSVITCTDQMREAFEGRGAAPGRIRVVMNSANEDFFDPERHAPVAPADGEFRLICHGSVEQRYGIDTIVRAVARLKDEIPGLRLAIYGEGSLGYFWDWRPVVARIQCPTLVILGDRSAGGFPASIADETVIDEVRRAMPQAGIVQVRGAGHMVHLDRPEDFVAAVESFLG